MYRNLIMSNNSLYRAVQLYTEQAKDLFDKPCTKQSRTKDPTVLR